MQDGQHSDSLSNTLNKEMIAYVRALLDEDQCYTVSNIHWKMADKYLNVVSRSTVHRVLLEALQLRKVSARWVSRELTKIHQNKQMGAALNLLTHYHIDGLNFFDQIIIGDKTLYF